MVDRLPIRRFALMLLYALEIQGTNPEKQEEFPLKEYRNLTSEEGNIRYYRALSKALQHETRALRDLFRTFTKRHESCSAVASRLPRSEKFVRSMQQVQAHIGLLSGDIATLRTMTPLPKKFTKTEELQPVCDTLLMRCAQLDSSITDALLLSEGITDTEVAAYAGSLRHIRRALAPCLQLAEPTQLEPNSEHANLAHIYEYNTHIRPTAESLAHDIYSHRAEWEVLLKKLLRRYIPTRMNVVDRCILYLSFYELKVHHLEPGIVISQANSLANTYSGSRSAPFVHGIIAAAIDLLRPSPPPTDTDPSHG